jgi:hypothetical protein
MKGAQLLMLASSSVMRVMRYRPVRHCAAFRAPATLFAVYEGAISAREYFELADYLEYGRSVAVLQGVRC